MNRSAVATVAAAFVVFTLACGNDVDRSPNAPNCADPATCSVAPGGGAAGTTVGMGGSTSNGSGSGGSATGGSPQSNGGAAGPGAEGSTGDGSGNSTTPVTPGGGSDAGTTPVTPGGTGGDAGSRGTTNDQGVFVPFPT